MANPEHLAKLKEGVEVWNAWRQERVRPRPNLCYANLRKTDLRGANLKAVDFSHADLRGTDLSGANLAAVDLTRANAQGACLARADLGFGSVWNPEEGFFTETRARLSYANLAGASFDSANLFAACLIETLLGEAKLSGAVLGETLLIKLDLSKVTGLGEVTHSAPSQIDVDTLYLSQGRIPRVFLRGCGLDEHLIEQLSALLSPGAIQFYSSFISYSHTDKPFARRLHDQLQARGIRCWLDEHDLKPGDRILDVVDGAIRLHDKLLICCSEASLQSWWVKDEIRKAQERERKEGRDLMIPLNLDRVGGWSSQRPESPPPPTSPAGSRTTPSSRSSSSGWWRR